PPAWTRRCERPNKRVPSTPSPPYLTEVEAGRGRISPLGAIQARLLHVGLHALGNEVEDGLALPNPAADVGRGDCQRRNVHDRDVRVATGRLGLEPSEVVSGPGGR